MTRYIAFLRKINVGGKNLMKMDELTRIFTAAGFKNARTYIQCGNVIFDSASANEVGLRKKIEKALRKALGYEVTVILRSLREIEAIVKRDPFRKTRTEGDVMLCIVFLADEPQHRPRLPLASKTERLVVFEVKDRAAFIIARRKQTGWFGFPNNFAEKELGVLGTTRQWSTLNKLLKAAERI